MSHLQGKSDHFDQIGNLYGLRTWIEYGFKQCKDQLGWADYRVTHYAQIERWWEIVSSAYLMVSWQFWGLGNELPAVLDEDQLDLLTRFRQHRNWNEPQGQQLLGIKRTAVKTDNLLDSQITRNTAVRFIPETISGWKRRLNNVQLLIQPFICFCSIKPWLKVFEIPALHCGFVSLIEQINQFPGWFPHVTLQRFSSA